MEIRHLPAKEYVINHSFYSKELIKKKKRIDEWQQQKKRVNEHSDNFNKERKYKKRLNRNCNGTEKYYRRV